MLPQFAAVRQRATAQVAFLQSLGAVVSEFAVLAARQVEEVAEAHRGLVGATMDLAAGPNKFAVPRRAAAIRSLENEIAGLKQAQIAAEPAGEGLVVSQIAFADASWQS